MLEPGLPLDAHSRFNLLRQLHARQRSALKHPGKVRARNTKLLRQGSHGLGEGVGVSHRIEVSCETKPVSRPQDMDECPISDDTLGMSPIWPQKPRFRDLVVVGGLVTLLGVYWVGKGSRD